MVAHRVSLARGICPPRSNQWTFQISQSKLVFTLNGKLRYYWSFKCPNKNAIAIESLRWEFSHNTKNPPNGRKINSLTSMMTTTNQFNRTIEFWIWFRLRRRTRSLRFAFSVCADTSLSLFYLIFVVRQTSQWLAPHGCLSEMFSFDVWFFFFFFFFLVCWSMVIGAHIRTHTRTLHLNVCVAAFCLSMDDDKLKSIDGATVKPTYSIVCQCISTWHSNYVQVEFSFVVVFLFKLSPSLFYLYLEQLMQSLFTPCRRFWLSAASCFGCDRSSFSSFVFFVCSRSCELGLSAPDRQFSITAHFFYCVNSDLSIKKNYNKNSHTKFIIK